jgi:hypothetical protein
MKFTVLGILEGTRVVLVKEPAAIQIFIFKEEGEGDGSAIDLGTG